MRIKNILLFFFIVVVAFSTLTLIFKKKYQANKIKGVRPLTFNDTIEWVSYYKDDSGPGIETKFEHRDTPYCFSGSNSALNAIYLDIAKKGDVLLKAKNSDSFFVKQHDTLIGFTLSECQ